MELHESEKSESAEHKLLESNDFVQNSYILMIGYLISSIISTIGAIIVIRLISVEENSIVNIAYILPGILVPLGELGLNYAATNFIARKMKDNDLKGVRNVIKITLIIKTTIGLIFTISVAYLSVFIAKEIYNFSDERIYFLIQVSSISIVTTILYEAMNAFFVGAQKMRVVQYGTMLRSISRTVISVFLILIGLNLLGSILGHILSTLIVVLFYSFFVRRTFKINKETREKIDWGELSKMMKYGYPLLIFSIIAGIQSQVFVLILTVSGYLDEVSYFNVAIITASLIIILTKAISLSLFPIFSKMDWDNEDEQKTLINYFQFSIKFSTLLIIPVTILLILFSEDIFPYVFGAKYKDATPFISAYFLMFLLVSFGSLTIPAFLNGQGQTKYVLHLIFVELISSLIYALILMSYFGAIGLVFGLVLGNATSVIYGYIIIRIKYGKILFSNFKNVFMIFLIAIAIGVLIYYFNKSIYSILPVKGFIIRIFFLGISFIIYGILFLFVLGVLSLINEDEIDFFVSSFQMFPIIDKIIIILANIEKKLLNLRFKKRK